MLVLYDGVPLHKLKMACGVTKFGMDLIESLVIASAWVVEVAPLHHGQLELDDTLQPVVLGMVVVR